MTKEFPLHYEELTERIQKAPITWLPALLSRVVKVCIIREVFIDDGAMLDVVKRTIKKARE